MAADRSRGAPGGARAASRAGLESRDRRRAVTELRALAHPLRLRLFELFAEAPRTTMQVAELIGEPPTRLYHHVNALERAGLLRLRETRPNRGTVEKYFEAVVAGFKDVESRTQAGRALAGRSARAAAGAVFEQARQDLFASLAEPRGKKDPGPVLLRMILSASPAKAAALRKRLLALVKALSAEFADCATGTAAQPRKPATERERWALTLAFAPSWPRRKSGGKP